jgi:transcriptional regulator with XRE-family HTH domain
MPLPNGPAIKAIREARGWKGVRLAAAVGISRFHLSNIENEAGKKASVAVLRRIADRLGVPLAAVTSGYTLAEIPGEGSNDEDDNSTACVCGAVA